MTTHLNPVPTRLRVLLIGILAALGIALAAPGGAMASIGCSGSLTPSPDGNGKGFSYNFKCNSPGGDTTTIDAYSIISSRSVSSFRVDPIVYNPSGEVVPDESFGCEGSFPSSGFGCFGKASVLNTVSAGLQLSSNPCSKKAKADGPWQVWVVANADRINDNGTKTDQSSEPFRLRVPKCGDMAPPCRTEREAPPLTPHGAGGTGLPSLPPGLPAPTS